MTPTLGLNSATRSRWRDFRHATIIYGATTFLAMGCGALCLALWSLCISKPIWGLFARAVVLSCVFCAVLTPLLLNVFGWVGVPLERNRETNIKIAPRIGGLGLLFAYLIGFIPLELFDHNDPSIQLVLRLSPVTILIFLVGLWDDVRGLSPLAKLAGQIVAAELAVDILSQAGLPGSTGLITHLLQVLWLVLCANSFNLIDGLDGLAAGVALIAASGLLAGALFRHETGLALVIAPLVGALLGLLYYNFNPASVFLGDCGSLAIGFLLGCYTLMWNQQPTTGMDRIVPYLALSLPLCETVVSVFRRFLRGRSIFSGDKRHFHHRLLSLGLNHRDAVLLLYCVAVTLAVAAVLQIIFPAPFTMVLLVGLFVAAYYGLRALRYSEFSTLTRFQFAGGLLIALRARILLRTFAKCLARAKKPEECWPVLRDTSRQAEFDYISMHIAGKHFEEALKPAFSATRVSVALPLSDEFSCENSPLVTLTFGHAPPEAAQAMLIEALSEQLRDRLIHFTASRGERQRPAVSVTDFFAGKLT
jgi:UDP-GlcNAc:undecaprenyl-phosphate/decaprenyl-phosphate GlcNAc-1-phosphate transferase